MLNYVLSNAAEHVSRLHRYEHKCVTLPAGTKLNL